MASKREKILVCGDVRGNLNQLYKRVSSVNQKSGPFSMLLCVGDFFGEDNTQWLPYKRGDAKAPLPTYILGPSHPDLAPYYPDLKGCELCENIIYLGPKGIYPCSSGLKIMYLSGVESSSRDKNCNTFSFEDVTSLETQITSKQAIDILITSQWPTSICNFSKAADGYDPESSGSNIVSRLAFKVRPRYHFAGLADVFFERLPYRNHKVLIEPTRNVTRFIGVAGVGNEDQQRWLYAFNITPMIHCDEAEFTKQPPDVTECPYTKDNVPQQPKKSETDRGSVQFFYDMNTKSGDKQGKRRKEGDDGGERKRLPPKPTSPCWFCLSSAEVEKHLVVSVGEHVYLALAKGGLVPFHLLILPITHLQSTSDLDSEAQEEVERYKAALNEMFREREQRVVFFERNYRTQHLQVQVVPVPDQTSTHVLEAFMDLAESHSIELDEIPKMSNISQIAQPGTPFFYAELPTGEKLYHRIKKNFPLQFGREALASPPILNIPERIDWRECKSSQEEDTILCGKIRKAFQPYDFTLDEDDDD
ncbi:hypothetical protein Pmani_005646 [Petrolisthes manimaculis]|uniref:CWF19-like protein 1 n=1 Tax=Petrolisthes manimaculis TaxID=1843537 RepID=A0AAE1UM03_9EUCA|nr:hypothetical protein Pmani_005646 [Petrolisthes manimaculis]